MNPGIAYNVAEQSFFVISYQVTNFLACTSTDSNITQWKDPENDHNSSLSLKLSADLELLVNQFNKATPDNNSKPEKKSSSKHYEIAEIHKTEIPHKNKLLSLFHINTCSLNKNFYDLQISWIVLFFWHNSNSSEKRITKQVSLSKKSES